MTKKLTFIPVIGRVAENALLKQNSPILKTIKLMCRWYSQYIFIYLIQSFYFPDRHCIFFLYLCIYIERLRLNRVICYYYKSKRCRIQHPCTSFRTLKFPSNRKQVSLFVFNLMSFWKIVHRCCRMNGHWSLSAPWWCSVAWSCPGTACTGKGDTKRPNGWATLAGSRVAKKACWSSPFKCFC